MNPTFWLNHIFFTTPYHWKNNTVCGRYMYNKILNVVMVYEQQIYWQLIDFNLCVVYTYKHLHDAFKMFITIYEFF